MKILPVLAALFIIGLIIWDICIIIFSMKACSGGFC